jgi:DNA transformation protein
MAVSAEDIEFATDLFASIGSITTRKMMGGLSIYADGQIFAMMFSDTSLMIKASGPLAGELRKAGSTQFTYTNKKSGKLVAMPYWTLPEAALDDPEEACNWARKSLKDNK